VRGKAPKLSLSARSASYHVEWARRFNAAHSTLDTGRGSGGGGWHWQARRWGCRGYL